MAKFGDRVKETTDTTGTGTLDLNGAPTGFLAFADEFNSGDDEISYLIVDDPENPTEWEAGKGTFTSGNPHTFARDTVERSSNNDNKVSFTSGTKTIVALPTATDLAAVFGDGGWGTKSAKVRAITSSDNMVAGDDGKVIAADASGNSPATLTYMLLAEATAGDGFVATIRNDGTSGTVDVDDDAGTLLKQLRPGEASMWRCDGTKWHLVAELIRPGVLSVTGDYTITANDNGKLILADGSGNSPAGLTLTFDSAATLGANFGVDIKNVGASGTVTVVTSNSPADGIDGDDSISLASQYDSASIACTGATFHRLDAAATQAAIIHAQEQQNSNTAGPTYAADGWRTVPLNTEITDTGTLASNAVTIPAGTYEYWGEAVIWANTSRIIARLRLYDNTAEAAISQGVQNIQGSASSGGAHALQIRGVFTIAEESEIEMQIYPENTAGASVLALNTGEKEVYSDLYLRKIA